MTAQRNALGRGLGALITPRQPSRDASDTTSRPKGEPHPDARSAAASEERAASGDVPRIRVDLIDPNPDQPRRAFDPDRLKELSESIAQSGVLQPVVVTRSGDRYTLLVGERRWRASRAAGLATIPAVIADVDPAERLELAIVENVQRHDLNPIELAHAYRALAERGATQDEIGRRVGKDRSSVANLLRLLELPVDIQADVEGGRLTMGHAKALLQVTDGASRRALRDRVLRDGLSVRETEQRGRALARPPESGEARAPRSARTQVGAEVAGAPDADLQRLETVLRSHFQSRVRISGTREKGRIEIEYTSAEDLDRATRLILEGL